jgi:acetyl-CoA acyltransferase
VLPDGTITFGCQTHPADANAGIIVAGSDLARELSRNPKIQVRLLGFGMERVEAAQAPAPAAKKALAMAGITVSQLDAIKLHNPFTANDFAFASGLGIDVKRINNYGCSLLWGHPQAPMASRGIMELIEELAIRGGGYSLVQRLRGWRQCNGDNPTRGRPALDRYWSISKGGDFRYKAPLYLFAKVGPAIIGA